MSKKVLVTGGLGFIGSHTTVELIEAGYTPILVDNLANSTMDVLKALEELTKTKLTFYKMDFQSQPELDELLAKESIDHIIHFAAFKAVGESVEQPLKYYDNNIAGLITLLEASQKAKVQNFIFSSSCTVYGNPDKLPATESTPFQPAASPYGATKQMGETIIGDTVKASKDLKAIFLRYFNPIGAHPTALIGELPRGVPSNLVPFITQTAAGWRDELTVFGDDYPTPDGTCIRDYIHVVDLAKAHVKALDKAIELEAGQLEMCNIGTGQGSSVLEVIKSFEKVSSHKLNYKIGPRRSGDVISIYASADKSQQLLGWQAQKTLDEALADAWRWQQTLKQPKGG